jgi:hypothetical protein
VHHGFFAASAPRGLPVKSWAVLVFIFSPRRRCLVTRSAARSLLVQKPGWAVFAQWDHRNSSASAAARSSGRATVSGNDEVAAVRGGKHKQKTAAAAGALSSGM